MFNNADFGGLCHFLCSPVGPKENPKTTRRDCSETLAAAAVATAAFAAAPFILGQRARPPALHMLLPVIFF